MSTNFYLVPKGQKDIQSKLYTIRNVFNKRLEDLIEEYKNVVKTTIEDLKNNENLKGILSYDNDDSFLDNMTMPYLWEYELPELHIGKRSAGWKFLFQTNDHWNNFDELEKFCKDNESTLEIEDEYGEKYTFEKFVEEEMKPTYKNENAQSHLQNIKENYYYMSVDYFLDNHGYEFTTHEFS